MGNAVDSLRQIYAELQAHRALPALAGTPLAWLEREREAALADWSARELPTRKDEAWKYTSLRDVAESEILDAAGADARTLSALEAAGLRPRSSGSRTAANLVFVNGRFVPQWSVFPETPGVHVLPLSAALRAEGAPVRSALTGLREIFASAAHKGAETPFAAMNASLFRDAALIVAEGSVELEAPVFLNFIHTGAFPGSGRLTASFPRVIVLAGARSSLRVIESHGGADGAGYLTAGVTDLHLGEGARLSHVRMQREGDESFHFGTTRSWQSRGSRLESLQISLGAKLSRQDLKVRLAEAGAEATVDGLYLTRGRQHADHHTAIEHAVGDTTSSQLYKGILGGESRAVFNGRVWIAKDAQRSSSSQLNNNLLLSPRAEVDTKPELEIFADDVKAGHGATIGRLDPEHLFYFKSRAIPEQMAVAMLAEGFAQDVVTRLSSEALREALLPPVRAAVRGLKVEAT